MQAAANFEKAKFLKIGEVCDFLRIGETTFKKMVKAGNLPGPVRMSPKCIRWRAEDIAAWSAQAGVQA